MIWPEEWEEDESMKGLKKLQRAKEEIRVTAMLMAEQKLEDSDIMIDDEEEDEYD